MNQILIDNSVLLLFIVAAIGYLIGNIKIKGSGLGVAAVLFTGLAFGAMEPRFHIPEIILLIGLSIFVYSIGLSSGPAFFKSYRKNGFKDFLFIFSMLILSGVIAAIIFFITGFSAAAITGIYTGSTTNTAALASVIDLINNVGPIDKATGLTEELVVGYTFSYPMGVLGGILAIIIMEKVLKIDYKKEMRELRKDYPIGDELTSRAIEITTNDFKETPLRDLLKKYDWNINFGRIQKEQSLSLVNWDTRFELGNIVMIVGNKEEILKVQSILGKISDSDITFDRKQFDVRKIFVSNSKMVGKTLASLNIHEKYDAVITRIRRGDIDMLAKNDMVLELGDRIRFIARREDLKTLATIFGDSYQESSKINLFSFGLGIGLGLLLGSVQFEFGPNFSFNLGYAGGPLIVGLILGALRRTGPIVWSLPYSVNITLQQLGLILLLTSIGVRSGNAFMQSLSIQGLWFFLAGTAIALLTAFCTLFIGYKIIKKPFSLLIGMVANQPAILDFAVSKTGNQLPVFGYAMMFPIALIAKIVIAQFLYLLLS